MKLLNLGLLSLLLTSSSYLSAETRALVVGINQYDHIPNLYGTKNDAEAIRDSLMSRGVTDILTLTDHKATKEAIHTRWFEMLTSANKGDVLIFTFSGHGGFEKDKDNEPNETDGKDQNFLLSSFSPAPAISKANQRIVDDEIHDWFYKARDKGVKIIFVADSCYSGSMTRNFSLKKQGAKKYDYSDKDLKPPTNTPEKSVTENDLPYVIFFSSSSDKLTTPEYNLYGKAHGMLSWAFANAISSKAERKKGVLTKGDLETYMTEIIKTTTQSTQTIGTRPKGHEDLILFSQNKNKQKENNSYRKPRIHFSSTTKISLKNTIKINNIKQADLIWNPQKGTVKNNTNDLISHGIKTKQAMQGVVSKWQLLDYLKNKIVAGHYAKSCLYETHTKEECPQNTSHTLGDKITFKIDKIRHHYLTQFNLAGDGTIQYLFPTEPQDFKMKIENSYELADYEVTPPFGEDRLVSIFSDKPLKKLQQALESKNNSIYSLSILPVLKNSLKNTNYQISIIDSYTTPK